MKKELNDSDFIFRLSGDEFVVVFMEKNILQTKAWMKNILTLLDERRAACGITYPVTFSYGFAGMRAGENLSVSDMLSIADTQMYVQKRNHHIEVGKRRLRQSRMQEMESPIFRYNKDYLFEALSESVDDYLFVGNLKTGTFLYSQRIVIDFGLPGQVVENAAAFWGERIHPDDADGFLESNQEVADGKVEKHAITYRARAANGKWVHLLCKGRMIRDESGNPDLFAGTIRNLDADLNTGETLLSLEKEDEDVYLKNLKKFILPEMYPSAGEKEAPKTPEGDEEEQAFFFTDYKLGLERLNTESDLLNFVNRNIPGGILAVYNQPGYPLICFNRAVLDYTHYTCEELVEICSGYYERLIFADDRKRVAEEISTQLELMGSYEVRYRLVTNGGQLIWVSERGKAVKSEDGRELILSFFVDISSEVERQQELFMISESCTDGIFRIVVREEFPILYANKGFYRIHGYTKEQIRQELGGNALPLIYEEDVTRVLRQLRDKIFRHETQITLEFRIRTRDDTIRWVHQDASLETFVDGSVVMTGMLMDVTNRRELEERLLRMERLFRIAKERTGLKVWELNICKQQIVMVDAAGDIHGFPDVIENVPEGMIADGTVHPESAEAFRSLYSKVFSGEEASAVIRLKVKGEDRYLWEKISYTSIRKKAGKPVSAIGISEDVTVHQEK